MPAQDPCSDKMEVLGDDRLEEAVRSELRTWVSQHLRQAPAGGT